MSIEYDVWSAVDNGYTNSKNPPVDTNGMKLCKNNSRSKNVIPCGIAKSMYTKVMHCASTKEKWEKL